jgi:EmrB/QacA subfamily drug resistance transporter
VNTAKRRGILLAVILGSGIVFLDSTVVNVALPAIGQELPSSFFRVLEAQSYIYNGYLLTLSALLILAGALADFYGRKRIFKMGLLGFGITSVLCAISPNMEMLILFRILQGASGALLVPGSLSIIRASFSGEAQGRAYGIWAAASGATTIFGPVLGGALVDLFSWRAAFFINIPIILVAYVATIRSVDESKDEEASAEFDWVGAALVVLAVGGLAFGAIRGQERQWQTPEAFIALAVGGIATIAFPFLMKRAKTPLVPLGLFSYRNFNVTNLSTFLIYGALYVNGYFFVIFIQGTLGWNATAAGFTFIPTSLLLLLFSPRFGTLAARYGPRLFMTTGPTLMAAGLVWLSRIPAGSTPWVVNLSSGTGFIPPTDVLVQVLPPLLLSGLGITIFVAPLTMALMTSVPERNAGVASALNNALSRVGPQLTGALIFVAVTATFFSGLGDRVPSLDVKSPEVRQAISPLNPPDESLPAATRAAVKESSTSSFALAMLLSAGMAVVGGLINLRIDNAQALKSSGSTTPAITVDPSTVTEANPEDED